MQQNIRKFLILQKLNFIFYIITSGDTRCKKAAIYIFHLQQCSTRHAPALSIGIYPSFIKKSSQPPFPPCLSQCNPSSYSFSACWVSSTRLFLRTEARPISLSSSCTRSSFQNFSHRFIERCHISKISGMREMAREMRDIRKCTRPSQ